MARLVPYFTPTGARISYIVASRAVAVSLMPASAPRVGAFLLGAPKSGTTWLASALEQHPGICVSKPKEPNEIATHKGTFRRNDSSPDWERYSSCYTGGGLRIDCSVHALACPIAPSRVADYWPEARFIVCLREPVSRTVSHWGMILDTEEDKRNGADWSDFAVAWADSRLHMDTLYGASMARWLEYFGRGSFLFIEAKRMRDEPESVLSEVVEHLDLAPHGFDLGAVHNTNPAEDRRPLTLFGRAFKFTASLIPNLIKRPVVSALQDRGMNVYKMPILSRGRSIGRRAGPEHYAMLGEQVRNDLESLEELTGFSTTHWRESLQ